jgi:hypothetical protein
MDVRTPQPAAPAEQPPAAPDRLGAEVRESALLLVLSVAVTAGVAGGAQALLALLS